MTIREIDYSNNIELINSITDKGLGVLYKDNAPISYPPILDLNNDRDELERLYESNEGIYLLGLVHEITFFISGQIRDDSLLSQIPFPLSGSNPRLTASQMNAFLEKARYCAIKQVNLMVSSQEDIETVKQFVRIASNKYRMHLYIEIGSVAPETIIEYNKSNPNVFIHLLGYVDRIEPVLKDFCHEILIYDEKSLAAIKGLPNINIKRLILLYNGDMNFFWEHARIEKETILKTEKNDIFIHQRLNPHFYGRLFVRPDGTVSDSHFGCILGGIDEMIHTLVYREVKSNGAWFLTRDRTNCNNCRFKYLCPSPSYYEILLDRYNICFLSNY